MDINDIDWMEVAVSAKRNHDASEEAWDELRDELEDAIYSLKEENKKLKAEKAEANQPLSAKLREEVVELRKKLSHKEENASRPMPTPSWEKLVKLGKQDKVILKFLRNYKLCPDIERVSSRTGIDLGKLHPLLTDLLEKNLIACQVFNGGAWYQITPAGVYCLARWSDLAKLEKPRSSDEALKLAVEEVCSDRWHTGRLRVSADDLCKEMEAGGMKAIMKFYCVGKVFKQKLEDSMARRGVKLST